MMFKIMIKMMICDGDLYRPWRPKAGQGLVMMMMMMMRMIMMMMRMIMMMIRMMMIMICDDDND